jgi:outer membrane protein TolC
MLVDTYSRKLQIARERVQLASKMLNDSQVRVEIGVLPKEDLLESRLKITEAEAQVKSLTLQLEEVRLTGQEPVSSVSAPAAGGRDFLSERWRVDLGVSRAALEVEQARLQYLQRRIEVGAGDPLDAQASRVRIVELEAAVETIQRRIEIRQRFIAHAIDATQAGLRVLEAEAQQTLRALQAKIEFARASADMVAKKVNVGAAQQVELFQAQLHLQELQADIAKAQLELALVLKQLKGR